MDLRGADERLQLGLELLVAHLFAELGHAAEPLVEREQPVVVAEGLVHVTEELDHRVRLDDRAVLVKVDAVDAILVHLLEEVLEHLAPLGGEDRGVGLRIGLVARLAAAARHDREGVIALLGGIGGRLGLLLGGGLLGLGRRRAGRQRRVLEPPVDDRVLRLGDELLRLLGRLDLRVVDLPDIVAVVDLAIVRGVAVDVDAPHVLPIRAHIEVEA